MRYIVAIAVILFGIQIQVSAQNSIKEDFKPVCDSLAVLLSEHTGVEGNLRLKNVLKRNGHLDFYFTETLGDFPIYKEDVKWIKSALKSLFPEEYSKYRLGEIYSRKVEINKLVVPKLTYEGKPADNKYKVKAPSEARSIVRELNTTQPSKGLFNRHIALWHSHGRYYDQSSDRWQWQRPCLFQTCEDMFTQGFVLQHLVPMLENAGAYILMPRERDTQRNEVITDNDKTCGARGKGEYIETGKWKNAGQGFADTTATYLDLENPFQAGTARQTTCVSSKSKATASVCWTPDIPERGKYAVYISYKTLSNSTSAAHYTVNHLGGKSEFVVNQKMGGGTWIYLGTFEFDKGTQGYVSLDNRIPDGYTQEVGAAVTADAVRFGGGTGNIARSPLPAPEDSLNTITYTPSISGLPRYAEGARYWLQWAGADTSVFYQNKGENDYRDDFMSRGDWVEWISRGSRTNPKIEGGLKIPVDLSLGFHTDAGVTPNDSIVGTLAIYTYKSENKTTLPAGENRMTSRMYADIVQTQIVNDLRYGVDTLWARRSIWDRGYRESRTPSCPAMLLELLSHQNFADMRHGLDPSFRFTVSRAVYKGMLKYLSNRYGCSYVVQPLPVDHVAVEFGENDKAIVSWKPVEDPLEPTAVPEGYILYRRIGNGAFDNGTRVSGESISQGYVRCEMDIPAGEVISFRIVAYNDGGKSFPSEVVSIGKPLASSLDSLDRKVLVVNNFDRVSGPDSFDGPDRAGFDNRLDGGVPYINDITFVGDMYNFNRSDEWTSNDAPGFGASYSDKAGEIVAGNTFDYAAKHGKAILEAGHAFYSCSNERFESDSVVCDDAWTLDMICGKQKKTKVGMQSRYKVFTAQIQNAIKRFTGKGGNIIISGANIGSDPEAESCSNDFIRGTLGYRSVTATASRQGSVKPYISVSPIQGCMIQIVTKPNPHIYCVESPDGIAPASNSAKTFYRYADSGISAAVAYQTEGYKAVSFGFPIEAVETTEMTDNLIINSLEYFKK